MLNMFRVLTKLVIFQTHPYSYYTLIKKLPLLDNRFSQEHFKGQRLQEHNFTFPYV